MFRRTLPVLASFTLLLAATPASAVPSTRKTGGSTSLPPATAFEQLDAKALLGEAKELWHVKQDYSAALVKFNAAVEADPADSDTRLQRAHFFETLASLVIPSDRGKFETRAQADYERIAAADPDSLVAGMARDGLTRLAGGPIIEVKTVTCPEAATEAHERADSLYGARKYAEAAAQYEKATAGCAENSAWWVDYADAYYVLEDYERAEKLFIKALSIDPWNREAHRFLADTKLQLRNVDDAVHQLVLAVASDPVYEGGWSALKTYATALGRSWHRVYGGSFAEPAAADAAAWIVYGAAKANAREARTGATSALSIEREAVKTALKMARLAGSGASGGPGPFWSMMARADESGYLDEAIFMHLLDAPLAAEYPVFREKNAGRLASYLETMILP